MAVFDIPITVPDDKVSELVDALNWAWVDEENGEMNGAELRAELKRRVEQDLQRIYKRHQQYLRDQQNDDFINIT
jgi:hypothetical protein